MVEHATTLHEAQIHIANLEKRLEQYQVACPKGCEGSIKTAQAPLQVLKEPNRKATTKSYVYCIRGGPPDKSVVLYGYNHAQHKLFVDD